MDTRRSSGRSTRRQPAPAAHVILALMMLTGAIAGRARAAEGPATAPSAAGSSSAAAILQDLRALRQAGSVLYVAAHPDDENTHLITYLARGRGYRTAYLSLTRGDGGQNVIGSEFGDALGFIRTHELLAARKLDKGRQFFTRALDFGFSKDYLETLEFWDRREVVADMVRVIRTFRPDVIVTRFSPEPGGTHGHHTASAVLAVEAFKLAGDAKAFPEQLATLKPWQPKRIVQNGRGGGGNVQVDVSGEDPVLGESFARIASRSRGMHVSQFGPFTGGGGGRGGGGGGPRPESFQLLAGEPAQKDLLDGVDTTWARFPGGAEVAPLIDQAIEKFDPNHPAASVPALLDLRRRLAELPADPVVDEKRRDLDRILRACLGLTVTTTLPQAEVVPGETMRLRHTAALRADVPVRWVAVRYPKTDAAITEPLELRPGEPAVREVSQTLPPKTPLSQPYWLREEGTPGMSHVADPNLIGLPENPPVFPVEHVFEVGGQTLTVADEPIQASPAGTSSDEQQVARLEVIPPVSLRPLSQVRLFAPGASKPVEVEVQASRANTSGTLSLRAPDGWKVEPASQPFELSAAGDRAKLSFTVTAPKKSAEAELTAVAEVNGATFSTGRQPIRYPHLPPLLLQPPARVKAVSLDLAIAGKRVGYLPGAGDSVADHLAEMGYAVTPLTGADLTPEKLRELDAVVVGVRAFNVRTDLADRVEALFAYVEGGGNVIVQYNRPDGLKASPMAPYPLQLSRDRVTEEDAAVTLLAPDHPALNAPNKITPADFEGWVQERGLYYANEWADEFTPILAAGDAGSKPLEGGLLIAKHGRGHFVYTGLAWFRQLPAGVPGAYRLFANLVSLGR